MAMKTTPTTMNAAPPAVELLITSHLLVESAERSGVQRRAKRAQRAARANARAASPLQRHVGRRILFTTVRHDHRAWREKSAYIARQTFTGSPRSVAGW